MTTATRVKEHRWGQRPAEDGDGQEIFCSGCGVISGRETTDECPAVDLDEATSELGIKPDVVARVAKAMGAEAAVADEIEHAAKVANGVAEAAALPAPAEPHLPFPVPPFDFERAFEQIESKRNGVSALETVWSIAKRRAKEASDEYLEAVKELDLLIRRLGDEKRAAERAVEPRLNLESRVADQAVLLCSFEKTHGERCYLCRPIDGEAPEPREDEHESESGLAWRAYLEVLAPQLVAAGYVVEADDLELMSDEDVEAARTWLASDHTARPTFVAEAHVAAEPGEEVQSCARCGAPLLDLAKGDQPVAPGTFVGMSCEPDEPAVLSEPEAEGEAAVQEPEAKAPAKKKGRK
jgi:hypothetical protein